MNSPLAHPHHEPGTELHASAPQATAAHVAYYDDRLLVQVDPTATEHLVRRHGLELRHPPRGSGLVSVAVPEHHTASSLHDLGTYVAVESLATVPVVAPLDLVNDDDHANDDHQHGTHIASIILSDGLMQGVAPGATLMPIKVLDASNAGDELALVEGIHHAVDHGAHVVNLSFSFGPGYQPSPYLLDAIDRAVQDGVVLVAAPECCRRSPPRRTRPLRQGTGWTASQSTRSSSTPMTSRRTETTREEGRASRGDGRLPHVGSS